MEAQEEQKEKIIEKIKSYLLTTKYGASSSLIAKEIGNNRLTVTKYLEVMKAQNLVQCEEIGPAKIWNLTEKTTKPTILIVDDEINVINLIKLSLMQGNYNLIHATSGKEGLEKVRQFSPNLVILDLMMPEINGYEVCKRMKENPLTQHIHVIILSAKGQLDDKIKGLTYGADDYMTKPFDPMELEARIKLILKYEESEQLLHPITKLPTKAKLMQYIKERASNKEEFTVFNFAVDNFDKYIESFGCKKANELLILISRIMQNTKKIREEQENEKTFISHTMDNNFVLVSNSKNVDQEIHDSFKKLLPYVYSEENNLEQKQKIALNIVKLNENQIDPNNRRLIDMLPFIKMEE